jgi:hypothetical protein
MKREEILLQAVGYLLVTSRNLRRMSYYCVALHKADDPALSSCKVHTEAFIAALCMGFIVLKDVVGEYMIEAKSARLNLHCWNRVWPDPRRRRRLLPVN